MTFSKSLLIIGLIAAASQSLHAMEQSVPDLTAFYEEIFWQNRVKPFVPASNLAANAAASIAANPLTPAASSCTQPNVESTNEQGAQDKCDAEDCTIPHSLTGPDAFKCTSKMRQLMLREMSQYSTMSFIAANNHESVSPQNATSETQQPCNKTGQFDMTSTSSAINQTKIKKLYEKIDLPKTIKVKIPNHAKIKDAIRNNQDHVNIDPRNVDIVAKEIRCKLMCIKTPFGETYNIPYTDIEGNYYYYTFICDEWIEPFIIAKDQMKKWEKKSGTLYINLINKTADFYLDL